MTSTPTIPVHLNSSLIHDYRPEDPANWWRTICKVTPQLFISGGLSHNELTAKNQLQQWEQAGVTHYIAVHEECDDRKFVCTNSTITYIKVGVDDNGTPRDPKWFEQVTSAAREVLQDPNAVLMVTCWMGANRGPSAAFAVLLTIGWQALPALRAIRAARPIAGIIYAPDAVEWWVSRSGGSKIEASKARHEVERWFDRNPLDLHFVIRSIGSRTGIRG